MALATLGCRADVDGWWSGTVGGEPMLLKIEQTGSSLEGSVCTEEVCTPIAAGEIEDQYLEVFYGCDDCSLSGTRLDLVLHQGELVGDADASPCACEDGDDCDCRSSATFYRCQGECTPGASR